MRLIPGPVLNLIQDCFGISKDETLKSIDPESSSGPWVQGDNKIYNALMKGLDEQHRARTRGLSDATLKRSVGHGIENHMEVIAVIPHCYIAKFPSF